MVKNAKHHSRTAQYAMQPILLIRLSDLFGFNLFMKKLSVQSPQNYLRLWKL